MPGTYIGTGKVADVHAEMQEHICQACLFDVELGPAPQRTLDNRLVGEREGIKVLGRMVLLYFILFGSIRLQERIKCRLNWSCMSIDYRE